MTLVLPAFCANHPSSSPSQLFIPTGNRNSTMPCGFDGEAMDFESAVLSAEWPSLSEQADDDVTKLALDSAQEESSCTGVSSSRKRKLSGGSQEEVADKTTAKQRKTSEAILQTEDKEASESKEVQADDPIDDLFYIPRRRVSLLWSPRLRWKDERRKVLKLSVNKLKRIEDPELFLRRSVLINNTVKRLQREIREEKSAKYQSHDTFSSIDRDTMKPWLTGSDVDSSTHDSKKTKSSQKDIVASADEENSCDEIFGINEDFLRINLPERRSVSPAIPEEKPEVSSSTEETESPLVNNNKKEVSESSKCTCCESNRRKLDQRSEQCTCSSRTTKVSRQGEKRHGCSQFRTNKDLSVEGALCQSVPILDSVVYHSLLASLES